ncbi:MAG: hypothetical protein NZ455_07625 [Bacteroidia bacterium]|nr:hypothetical protein [Bacteroidia bacterium]
MRSPSPTLLPLPRGWGAAPKRSAARSTPTLWAYAQRNAHKGTPKIKFINNLAPNKQMDNSQSCSYKKMFIVLSV